MEPAGIEASSSSLGQGSCLQIPSGTRSPGNAGGAGFEPPHGFQPAMHTRSRKCNFTGGSSLDGCPKTHARGVHKLIHVMSTNALTWCTLSMRTHIVKAACSNASTSFVSTEVDLSIVVNLHASLVRTDTANTCQNRTRPQRRPKDFGTPLIISGICSQHFGALVNISSICSQLFEAYVIVDLLPFRGITPPPHWPFNRLFQDLSTFISGLIHLSTCSPSLFTLTTT